MIYSLCSKRDKSYIAFFLIVMVITMGTGLLVGCEDFETNAYKSLKTSAILYDTGMWATSNFYKSGVITEQQKNAIVKAGSLYRTAYLSACGFLLAYHNTGSTSDKDRFNMAVVEYSAALSEMIRLVSQCSPRSEDVENGKE